MFWSGSFQGSSQNFLFTAQLTYCIVCVNNLHTITLPDLWWSVQLHNLWNNLGCFTQQTSICVQNDNLCYGLQSIIQSLCLVPLRCIHRVLSTTLCCLQKYVKTWLLQYHTNQNTTNKGPQTSWATRNPASVWKCSVYLCMLSLGTEPAGWQHNSHPHSSKTFTPNPQHPTPFGHEYVGSSDISAVDHVHIHCGNKTSAQTLSRCTYT